MRRRLPSTLFCLLSVTALVFASCDDADPLDGGIGDRDGGVDDGGAGMDAGTGADAAAGADAVAGRGRGTGCGDLPSGMVCVPGASYVRGSDDGPENERPAGQVTVSTFLLDTHEVDNAHYRECVEAGECRRLVRFPGYMSSEQPAVGMRWVDADSYCRWRGKRLPTEAEWERAARGDTTTRFWWGDEEGEPCEHAIVRTREGRGCGTGVTFPPGSRPPGPFGLYDMAGNVWEWVADHYSWCYRGCGRECGDACFGTDPQGRCGDPHAECPESLGHRTVRGGSWWYFMDRSTVTGRRGIPGENPNPHRFGFRCARSVGEDAE